MALGGVVVVESDLGLGLNMPTGLSLALGRNDENTKVAVDAVVAVAAVVAVVEVVMMVVEGSPVL